GAAGDLFGSALAAGDFNADGFQDLAIGAPGQTVSGNSNAGAVSVLYGTRTGPQIPNNQFWTADTGAIVSDSNQNAMFGFALAAADFNGDSRADLAIGAPGENLPTIGAQTAVAGAGGVHILFGSATRLTDAANQWWNENIPGIVNT